MAIKSFSNIDFDSKGGVQNSNETIDYSQSAEPTLNTSKEDTLKGHLSYFAKGVNWIKSQFSKYLPLAGGTMTGNLDMGGKSITNAKLYETNLQWGNENYVNTSSQYYIGNANIIANSTDSSHVTFATITYLGN